MSEVSTDAELVTLRERVRTLEEALRGLLAWLDSEADGPALDEAVARARTALGEEGG